MKKSELASKLQSWVGKKIKITPGGEAQVIEFMDWDALSESEKRSFCFTHLHMLNASLGGNGEKIVIDQTYRPIALSWFASDEKARFCLVVNVKSGDVLIVQSGVAPSPTPMQVQFDRFLDVCARKGVSA